MSNAWYQDLEGKSVLVTGGATGIGAFLVRSFCKQGARVAFVDIDENSAQVLQQEMEGLHGVMPLFCRLDITELDEIRPTVKAFEDELGPFSVLVNNAANDARHTPEDLTPESWGRKLDVNLSHQFFFAQAVAPGMKKLGGGSIINMGSVCHKMSLEDLTAYSAAKSAVTGLSRSLAREWGQHNIRVNELVPGCIMTDKQLELWISPEDEAEIMDKQCLKRRLIPEDVASTALFLASAASSACTAQSFTVDGGVV